MEPGSQVTPFEHKSIGEVTDLCHRYYFRNKNSSSGYPLIWAHPITTGSAQYRRANIQLPVEMRTTPSFTVTVVFGGAISAGTSVPYAQFQTANGASIVCDS